MVNLVAYQSRLATCALQIGTRDVLDSEIAGDTGASASMKVGISLEYQTVGWSSILWLVMGSCKQADE